MASVSHKPYVGREGRDPRDDDEQSGPRALIPGPRTTEWSRWHVRRHHAILRDHPEVKRLFGTEPTTAVWVVALGLVQIGLAIALRHAPWVAILAVVLVVGAPVSHALGVLIHECAHNLAFKSTWKNKALSIVANLPLGAPAAIEFRYQHLLHHRYLGDVREPDGGDTQAPTAKDVAATGGSTWWKILHFTFGRFFFGVRATNKVPRDAWLIANAVACIGVSLVVALAFGPRAIAYILLSPLFGFGPHPMGARRIAEHVTLRAGQPTSSYYGVANWVSFNVGYHVEHHDFPFVPWTRLPQLRDEARAEYESLAVVRSWTRTLVDHFFGRRRHLGQYVGLSEDFVEEGHVDSQQQPLPPLV
jgi:sphingolipid delta-4 desaturase